MRSLSGARTLGYLTLVFTLYISSVARADGGFASGHATVHDGEGIYYEVHGTGSKFLLFGFQLQPQHKERVQEFVAGLGQEYKLIIAQYPGTPKMYTLTPSVVARDYLEIAKSAGADEFAFYGYSWGAACGLQLALQTDRLKALVAGGFPMMDGPYPEMLSAGRAAVFDNAPSPHTPDAARQYLTFYEGMQSFDDRSIQHKLKMPRLNFLGTKDRKRYAGVVEVDFYKIVAENETDMKEAGWDVIFIPGENHDTAFAAKFVVPILRKWLKENWKD